MIFGRIWEFGSDQAYILVTLLASATVIYLALFHQRYKPFPLVGHLSAVVGKSQQEILQWLLCVSRHFEGGPWRLEVPTISRGWFVNDPATLKYVLSTKHAAFSKGRFFTERTRDLFGHGILLATGKPWRAQRTAGLALTSVPTLDFFAREILPGQLQVMLDLLDDAANGQVEIDFSAVAEAFSLAVFGKIAFDSDSHDLKVQLNGPFMAASGRIADRFHLPFYSFLERLTYRGTRLRSDLSVLHHYTRQLVQRAMDDKRAAELGEKEVDGRGDGILIRALLENDLGMSMDEIADSCLNFLTAGVDTTAQALTWTLYLLLRHPHYLKALHEELDTSSVDRPDRNPTSLPLLRDIINESLRLQPPIPIEIVENISNESILLPNGKVVPPGEQVMWSTWVMARLNASTWGADPELFRPERWEELKHRPSAYEWPVFHAGPRSCLGQAMARSELTLALKYLLERYEFEMAWDGGERGVDKGLTAPIRGGLPVRVRRRKT